MSFSPRTESDDLGDDPFSVLVVCTANVCRSPMAEYLLRDHLRRHLGRDAGWDWVVRSAGTHVSPGSTTHHLARDVLHERGVPIEGGIAQQATGPLLERADLILTASRPQRAWVVERCPSAVRRVFTMRQFARLCRAGRAELQMTEVRRGTQLVTAAAAGRARVQPVAEEDDLIEDPIGHGVDRFRSCADVIESCLVDMLGPPG